MTLAILLLPKNWILNSRLQAYFGGGSVVVDLLIYLPPIVCEGSVLVFVLVCITLCPFLFCNYLDEVGGAGCFSFIVFLTA